MTTGTTTAPTQEKVATLNAADRCDQCGAQAYFRTVIPTDKNQGSTLLFCAHHFRKGETKLRAVATDILDESWRLEE